VPGLDLPETVDWASWKAAFRRNYTHRNPDGQLLGTYIEARRRAAFDANVARIRRHNAEADAGRRSFRMGVNGFSDLTYEEWRAAYLDLRYASRRSRRPGGGHVRHLNSSGPPPKPAWDWRGMGAVTPVKTQGQCGACWAFAATGSAEGAYQIATGALRTLSEQQLLDCGAKEGGQGCMGGTPEEAFNYMVDNNGLDSEGEYKYMAGQLPCWYAAEEREVATIDKYSQVLPHNSEPALVAAVAQVPVAVAIDADQPDFQSYRSGVYDGRKCGTTPNHGVLVVGYTAQYWIVKNSWGTKWGESGYVKSCTRATLHEWC